ncbi:uncharacterized protein LOC106719322 [Papilio machaon]|uniref:uncharacterized protein LOC106719322 n=1 Tax=Papilio machaon TaxID=76193 RepID=UPI001E663FE7|nr:uncharacterized protein LOC106719322 [Papilio machaon]
MFETFLSSIPKSRSEMVNELDLPDDLTVAPYVWTEREDSPETSDSLVSAGLENYDAKTLSTDSSLALSRAMTDSEIDYERYRRYKNRSFSDPWIQMKAVLDSFPPDYLASVDSFKSSTELSEEVRSSERRLHAEELRLKMERFFEEECRVFSPDDPGLLSLEEALQHLDDCDSNSTP